MKDLLPHFFQPPCREFLGDAKSEIHHPASYWALGDSILSYSTDELLKISKEHVIYGWDHNPTIFTEGKGVILKDTNGNEYIDCTSQAWSVNIGHQHPRLIKATKDQIDKLIHIVPVFDHPARLLLAKKLADIAPGNLKKSLFTTSGSEAVEGAILVAMKYSKAQTILTLYHGFHGRTIFTRAASYLNQQKIGFERFSVGFPRVPNFYCYRCYFGLTYPECGLECARFIDTALEHMADGKMAGLIVEPVQGNGGQIAPPKGYLNEIRKICNDHSVPLIFDEVQTGFGRCGKMFAADYYEVTPDVMALGKAFGSGFPIGGVLTSDEFNLIEPGDFQFTHTAHPVCCVAASTTIDILVDEKLPENAAKMGEYFTKRLNELAKRYEMIGEVRGPGLNIGIEFVKDRKTKKRAMTEAQQFVNKAFKKGVIFGLSGVGGTGNVVKVKPPLCIDEGEAAKVIQVFEATLKEIR